MSKGYCVVTTFISSVNDFQCYYVTRVRYLIVKGSRGNIARATADPSKFLSCLFAFVPSRPIAAMHPQELLAQAQQGNPKVIAAILNHALKPRGIMAQVARQDQCLYILLEAIAVPPEAEAIALVSTLLHQLNAQSIETAVIHGQRTGDKSVAWKQEILLHAEAPAPTTSAFDVTQTADSSPINPAAPAATQPLFAPEAIEPVIAPMSPIEAQLREDPQPLEGSEMTNLQPNPWNEPTPAASLASVAIPIAAPAVAISLPRGPEAIAAVQSAPSPKLEEVLRRPEAVVLLLFVSVLILWQAYLDLTESAWEGSDVALSSTALAERLGVSRTTIYRRKNSADFGAWSQALDPDGIAWVYVTPKFIPALM